MIQIEKGQEQVGFGPNGGFGILASKLLQTIGLLGEFLLPLRFLQSPKAASYREKK
jgi:hypothetical protein